MARRRRVRSAAPFTASLPGKPQQRPAGTRGGGGLRKLKLSEKNKPVGPRPGPREPPLASENGGMTFHAALASSRPVDFWGIGPAFLGTCGPQGRPQGHRPRSLEGPGRLCPGAGQIRVCSWVCSWKPHHCEAEPQLFSLPCPFSASGSLSPPFVTGASLFGPPVSPLPHHGEAEALPRPPLGLPLGET